MNSPALFNALRLLATVNGLETLEAADFTPTIIELNAAKNVVDKKPHELRSTKRNTDYLRFIIKLQ